MLTSELKGWYYLITWDNAVPTDSSTLKDALRRIGRISELQPRTTVLFAPRAGVAGPALRRTISAHLHPRKGGAAYSSLRSKAVWEFGRRTGGTWRKVA